MCGSFTHADGPAGADRGCGPPSQPPWTVPPERAVVPPTLGRNGHQMTPSPPGGWACARGGSLPTRRGDRGYWWRACACTDST